MIKKIDKSRVTVAQATVIASFCSLIGGVAGAIIAGVFDATEAELVKTRDETIEKERQEGGIKTEKIRQLTAKIVEDARSEGSVKIEQFRLQRDLILQAIDTEDRIEAQKRLRFFAQTGLIPIYEKKVLEFTDKKDINDIPSITKSVTNGQCKIGIRNACWAGVPNDVAVGDTSTYYRWRCDGQNGGNNSGTCKSLK